MAQTAHKGPAARAYQRGLAEREPYLERARRISRLTITSLFRDEGDNAHTSVVVPWQTFGAYAVNTLAAKYVIAVFPPGIPYIKLKPTREVLLETSAMTDPDQAGKLRAEIDKGLSAVETEFAEACEEDGDRMVSFDTARHLIIGGNHCEKTLKGGRIQGIPLERYVVFRDKMGNVLEAVIEDPMSWESLPDDIKRIALDAGYEVEYEEGGSRMPKLHQQSVCVYTHIIRKGERYETYQEVWGRKVPGTEATYADYATLPYNFLRMVALKNESYGRSHCEDYEGDLQTLDGLWQIIVEGSAALAQLKWLVKPGGVTNKKTFAELPNGGVMTGDPEDVGAVVSEKQRELEVAASRADRIEQRLSRVFLLYSSIQREGERVTREEIITMRQDLDAGLGGVYSNAAVEWQFPRAQTKMGALQRAGRMTRLPKGTTKMTVLTGDAALGREMAAQAMDDLLASAAAHYGAQFVAQYTNPHVYLMRKGAALHVDTDGLVKSEEQVQQDMEDAAQTQLALTVAPEAVKQGGEMMQTSQQAALAAETPQGA